MNKEAPPFNEKDIQKGVEDFMQSDDFRKMMEETDLGEIVNNTVGDIERKIIEESANNLQENILLKESLGNVMDIVTSFDEGLFSQQESFIKILELIRPIIKGAKDEYEKTRS